VLRGSDLCPVGQDAPHSRSRQEREATKQARQLAPLCTRQTATGVPASFIVQITDNSNSANNTGRICFGSPGDHTSLGAVSD
jgi:hypothetical protein